MRFWGLSIFIVLMICHSTGAYSQSGIGIDLGIGMSNIYGSGRATLPSVANSSLSLGLLVEKSISSTKATTFKTGVLMDVKGYAIIGELREGEALLSGSLKSKYNEGYISVPALLTSYVLAKNRIGVTYGATFSRHIFGYHITKSATIRSQSSSITRSYREGKRVSGSDGHFDIGLTLGMQSKWPVKENLKFTIGAISNIGLLSLRSRAVSSQHGALKNFTGRVRLGFQYDIQ